MAEDGGSEDAVIDGVERGFVRILGGYTVGLSGGTLLVNERLPLPRLNLVQSVTVARQRLTQFFEAALVHYYARGLRPEIRVTNPVPDHVRAALERLGFRSEPAEERWLATSGGRRALADLPTRVQPVPDVQHADVVPLWAGGADPLEFARQVEVGIAHPNPGESLGVFRAVRPDGRTASACLAYRRGDCLDLELVTTAATDRGQGWATTLVEGVLASEMTAEVHLVVLRSTEPRLADRLGELGFRVARGSTLFHLDPAHPLVVDVPASIGPNWRPPRRPG